MNERDRDHPPIDKRIDRARMPKRKALSLADQLALSMEGEAVVDVDDAREHERADDDEGSFGG